MVLRFCKEIAVFELLKKGLERVFSGFSSVKTWIAPLYRPPSFAKVFDDDKVMST